MDIHLVVVKPFSGFARGDVISDAARMNEILKSERISNVVRVVTTARKEG
jgi:hypothetical protein